MTAVALEVAGGTRCFAAGRSAAWSPSARGQTSGAPRPARTAVAAVEAGGFLPLQALEPSVADYFASSPPFYAEMKAFLQDAPFTSHWAHAIGGMVLFSYAAYGIFLGYQIRAGNRSVVYPGSYDQTAAERHPWMMGITLLFLLFEIPDGLTLLAANDVPLLRSTHASTAFVCIALMAAVGILGYLMGGSKKARDAHAYAGGVAVVALVAHAYFGVALGWSL